MTNLWEEQEQGAQPLLVGNSPHPGAKYLGVSSHHRRICLLAKDNLGDVLPLPVLSLTVLPSRWALVLCMVASDSLSKQHFTERRSLFYNMCPVRLTFKRISHLETFPL